jgi:UDP-N-acetyl-D-glucosamine dehydrogenase
MNNHEPDLSCITDTAKAIAPHLRAGQLVVLEKHDLPRHDRARRGSSNGQELYVAFSPQRKDRGNTTAARRDIPKVVDGLDPQTSEMAAALYGTIFKPVVRVSSPAAAEMTKLLENIYRCVNIALVNELKMLSLRMGLDIWKSSRRLPPSPLAFSLSTPVPAWVGTALDFRTRFIELAGEVNFGMPYHMLDYVAKALNQHKKSLNSAKVLVLGLARTLTICAKLHR